MTDINKLMAQALVEQGYALGYDCNPYRLTPEYVAFVRNIELPVDVDPFSDTLEGYRQLFALVDWLRASHKDVFYKGYKHVENGKPAHEQIISRIKWCFEQLAGESDD